MVVKRITIKNPVGLYARPATFFIQKANDFSCSIWVEKENRKVNAKSLLGVSDFVRSNGTCRHTTRPIFIPRPGRGAGRGAWPIWSRC